MARAVIDLGEATWICPRIWQGSRPLPGTALRDRGFDALVLCAMEHQPESELFDIPVYRVHLNDDGTPAKTEELAAAARIGGILGRKYAAGERLLVTCWAGINRSGLVTALTLRSALGVSGAFARTLVQSNRHGALTNKYFAAYLDSLPPLSGDECPRWSDDALVDFLQRPHPSQVLATKLRSAPAFRR